MCGSSTSFCFRLRVDALGCGGFGGFGFVGFDWGGGLCGGRLGVGLFSCLGWVG
jgi:hypothetical protein